MKLFIEIDNSEPLQLSTFCQSMEGIAAEYQQFIQDNKKRLYDESLFCHKSRSETFFKLIDFIKI
jgi:hypothetical protein